MLVVSPSDGRFQTERNQQTNGYCSDVDQKVPHVWIFW